jgi:hypothetical protein
MTTTSDLRNRLDHCERRYTKLLKCIYFDRRLNAFILTPQSLELISDPNLRDEIREHLNATCRHA